MFNHILFFEYLFFTEGAGTSSHPCSEVYHGSSALSEVEIKGVVNFLTNLKASGKQIRLFIDWHSYSQLWMAPWSYSQYDPDPVDTVDQVWCSSWKNSWNTLFDLALQRSFKTVVRKLSWLGRSMNLDDNIQHKGQ